MGINQDGSRPVSLFSVGVLLLMFFGNCYSGNQYGYCYYMRKKKRKNEDAVGKTVRRYRNEKANEVDIALRNISKESPKINDDDNLKIVASLTSTLLGGAKRPAVFLFLKPNKQGLYQDEDACDKLVHEIAETCNKLYQPDGLILIKKSYLDFVTDEAVMENFDLIEKAFSEKTSKVVLIENVDKIKNENVFTNLHNYCDNDVAPHKDVTFIFTATVPEHLDNETMQTEGKVNNDGLRNTILNEAWTHFEQNKRKALIARVGANTILIARKDETRVDVEVHEISTENTSPNLTGSFQRKIDSGEQETMQNNELSSDGNQIAVLDVHQVGNTTVDENQVQYTDLHNHQDSLEEEMTTKHTSLDSKSSATIWEYIKGENGDLDTKSEGNAYVDYKKSKSPKLVYNTQFSYDKRPGNPVLNDEDPEITIPSFGEVLEKASVVENPEGETSDDENPDMTTLDSNIHTETITTSDDTENIVSDDKNSETMIAYSSTDVYLETTITSDDKQTGMVSDEHAPKNPLLDTDLDITVAENVIDVNQTESTILDTSYTRDNAFDDNSGSKTLEDEPDSKTSEDNRESKTSEDHPESKISEDDPESKTSEDAPESKTTEDAQRVKLEDKNGDKASEDQAESLTLKGNPANEISDNKKT